jgi:hypothetical protein
MLDILQDRERLAKLIWLAFISSVVMMGIGILIILKDIFG